MEQTVGRCRTSRR